VKTFYDCIPCLIRQALDAVRLASHDERIHEAVLRGVLHSASEMDLQKSPPEMAQQIHRLIRRLSGCDDPYKELKDRYNRYALVLYPELKQRLDNASDPFETAVRFAIAGNIIDFGVSNTLEKIDLSKTIEQALSERLLGEAAELNSAIASAEKILYLGDNAGEIVFDRLLIEELPSDKVTFVVKGSPIINDATMDDARTTGMTDIVHVVDNGSDAPGTILEDCSDTLRQLFIEADLIIAKGQGNYETLTDVKRNIFFILKAKCPVIAKHLDCDVGSLVVRQALRDT
jgi:uncharacterized protein with ATP-grasp and redox domains